MKLSIQEIEIMTHLQSRHPKGSSLKQLNLATDRCKEELTKALGGLTRLTLITVSKKDEVILRTAGKQYLGITTTSPAERQPKLNAAKGVVAVETPSKSKSPAKKAMPHGAVFDELEALSRQLQGPTITLKNKTEKVKLLADLSEKLKPTAPYVSEQLLEIANVLHGLNEAA
ncbi:MAG: hypothetical protein JKY26_01480 [Pseudomonas sp.]|nr:hypothetical protein [Pseudomonas sp.]